MSVLEVGDTAVIETELTQEDIETFAALSGDSNPLHLDEEYAATTRFDGRIAPRDPDCQRDQRRDDRIAR
jgi:Acyl dehydratase